jgi:hypothetical protein
MRWNVALRPVGQPEWRTGFGHHLVAQFVRMRFHGIPQLLQTLQAERMVGGPVALVKRTTRSRNGALHVFRARIGTNTRHTAISRIDVVRRFCRMLL